MKETVAIVCMGWIRVSSGTPIPDVRTVSWTSSECWRKMCGVKLAPTESWHSIRIHEISFEGSDAVESFKDWPPKEKKDDADDET